MASSPDYKVYNRSEYVAACKYPEDAAAIVAAYGEGATIRFGHRAKDTVWREGKEDQSAGDSYDFAAAVVADRIRARKEG